MKQLVSSILLLFFFLGQVNLSWAEHYCGDELMNSELTFSPEKNDCSGSENDKLADCCENQITTADADDHFSKSEVKVSISAEFVLAYALSLVRILISDTDSDQYDTYSENLPAPNLHLLHQTFLI
jgi:hypothetical protein